MPLLVPGYGEGTQQAGVALGRCQHRVPAGLLPWGTAVDQPLLSEQSARPLLETVSCFAS